MERYAHGGDIYRGSPVELDFSVNLNPYGMPEAVKGAVREGLDAFATYPDPECTALRAALSERHAVPAAQILCGNGADDLIYRLCFAARPKRALVCAPSFSEYEKAVLASGGEVSYHLLREQEDFELTDRILDELAGIDLIFLCSPNNPTGKLIDPALIARIVATGVRLLLDECFLAFTRGSSATGLLERYKNLVILGAFTKTYAMAGLRLGYAMTADTPLIAEMKRIAPCWSVSGPAQAAGLRATECTGVREKLLRLLEAERPRVKRALEAFGFRVWRSDCGFLLFTAPADLGQKLRARGIAIRDCSNYPGLGVGFWRIGLKLPEQNDRLLRTIEEVI